MNFRGALLRLVWMLILGMNLAPSRAYQRLTPGNEDLPQLDNLKWRSIGPAATSGRIADIAVVETDPDIVYVATATGGAWKSSNRGTTWEPVFEKGGTASLGAIAVAPSNPNVVWIGSGEAWSWRSSPGAMESTSRKTEARPGNIWDWKKPAT